MAKKKKRYDDGGEIIVTAPSSAPPAFNYSNISSAVSNAIRNTTPSFSSSTGGGGGSSTRGAGIGGFNVAGEKMYGIKRVPLGTAGTTGAFGVNPGGGIGGRVTVPIAIKKGGEAKTKKMAKGGKLTDLTGDGKVTRADVLKGRGVPGFAKGGNASKRGDGCAQRGKTRGKMV